MSCSCFIVQSLISIVISDFIVDVSVIFPQKVPTKQAHNKILPYHIPYSTKAVNSYCVNAPFTMKSSRCPNMVKERPKLSKKGFICLY